MIMSCSPKILDLANSIASRLANVAGVRAVVIGGSQARGTAVPGSDLDIGIYYLGVLDTDAINGIVKTLCPTAEATPVGGWGPWIDGGAWLEVEGQKVDFIYRDLQKVEDTIRDCLEGRVTRHLQPGHPHGFFNHIYAAEVHYAIPVSDTNGVLARLKSLLGPYPPRLRQAIIDNYLWQATFALDNAAKATSRVDTFYVAGCMFECVGCLIQVLHALNGVYFLNEKGSVAAIDQFELKPKDFSSIVWESMGTVGHFDRELDSNVAVLRSFAEEARRLANGDPLAQTGHKANLFEQVKKLLGS